MSPDFLTPLNAVSFSANLDNVFIDFTSLLLAQGRSKAYNICKVICNASRVNRD